MILSRIILILSHLLPTFDDGGVYNLIQNEETVTDLATVSFIFPVSRKSV